MTKRLYRIEYGKRIAGVCGGIAEYLNVDPTLIRIAWVLLVFCVGGAFSPTFSPQSSCPANLKSFQNSYLITSTNARKI